MAARLKIILPMNTSKWNRVTTDRPNVATSDIGMTVKRVPELLQPYIPRKDWIEFCDKLADANQKVDARRCCYFGVVLGVSLLAVGIVLTAHHEYLNRWWLGVSMIVVGIVVVPVSYRAGRNLDLASRTIRTDACNELSDKLKTVRICYRVYRRPKGKIGRHQTYDVHHQLEVLVGTDHEAQAAEAAQTATEAVPFFGVRLVDRGATFLHDDRWEVLGGLGHETPGDFAAAHRAATTTTVPATEVPSGSADDNRYRHRHRHHGSSSTTTSTSNRGSSNNNKAAILLDQLDAMKGKLTDEQYETIAAQILDSSVRSIDLPSNDGAESGEGTAEARIEHLDSIKGDLTKGQYEARLKEILESI